MSDPALFDELGSTVASPDSTNAERVEALQQVRQQADEPISHSKNLSLRWHNLYLLSALFWVSPSGIAQSGADLQCSGSARKTVPLQIEKPVPSAQVSGDVSYCSEYSGKFQIRIDLENLKPSHGYMLSLNGWNGREGNDILKKKGQYGDEGVYDFAPFRTGDSGSATGLHSIEDLEPSRYEVKLFVKDMSTWEIPLKNDLVSFEMRQPSPTTLELPASVKSKQIVRGKLVDPSKHVYVLVHPLTTDVWWVQNPPSTINRDGSWVTIAFFGTETEGIGEPYEIIAVVSDSDRLFQRGQEIDLDTMREYLNRHPHSDILVVERPE